MEHSWYSSYDSGVAHSINTDEYSSINEIIESAFQSFPDRPSFTCMGKTLTYAEIDRLSLIFASYLQNNLGLEKGSRVALMMPNILQYPIALFGILRAGMIAVNVNPLYTERELEHQLVDSEAETIVICTISSRILQKVRKKTPVTNIITTQIGDLLGFPKSLIVNTVIKHVKKMAPMFSLPDSITLNTALALGDVGKYKQITVTRDDIAFLQYTGGTTGISKGAILSHGNIIANMLQAKEWIKSEVELGKEIIITPLPLYHIFSLTANCFVFTSIGGLNVLITNPTDIPDFVRKISKYKFTAFTGVNTLFNALLNNDDFKKLDFGKLKVTLGGGMAVQRLVAETWKEVTGKPLIEAYGLTEASPAVSVNPFSNTEYNGTIGVPLPSTEMKIIDDDEKEVVIGEPGEIVVKGPQVMQGYWRRPDETAKVMTKDGFFKTGDIGIVNEKGFFKIVDRKKDMILVSGFNVYPNEVEDVIAAHPKVMEVAAIGIPSEKSGEVVKVFIVKRDSTLTEDEVKEYCKKELTGYKVPKAVEFKEELPKSNVGKIIRKELREQERAKAKVKSVRSTGN